MNRTPLPELVRVLLALGSYGQRLDPATATDEQLDIVARALDEARRLARTAQGPASGCARHPNGPTDPTRGGACLFCSGRRRPRLPDGPPSRTSSATSPSSARRRPPAATPAAS